MIFVAGNTRQQALRVGHQYLLKNKYPIINYAIESTKQGDIVTQEYLQLIKEIPNNNFSLALKLSSFEFDIHKVSQIISSAQQKNIKVYLDAEQDVYHENYQQLGSQLMFNYNSEQTSVLKTYQLYRRDSSKYLSKDLEICSLNNTFFGAKLVRGAYWNTEQETGNLFLEKKDTDSNYNQAILDMFAHPYPRKKIFLATHNKFSSEIGQTLSKKKNIFEFGHLQGMRENYYQQVSREYLVSVYIPYGPYKEMIPYLGRRLYENFGILTTIF